MGVTVYLEGSPELLAKRVLAQDNAASRPLLAAEDGGAPGEEATREKLEGLLRQRGASYANADCTVGLDGSGELGASAPQVRLAFIAGPLPARPPGGCASGHTRARTFAAGAPSMRRPASCPSGGLRCAHFRGMLH